MVLNNFVLNSITWKSTGIILAIKSFKLLNKKKITFKNTYVDTCALKEIIGQGVRALDFQIYSVDNLPVIAVSSIGCDYSDASTDKLCYNIKESYKECVPKATIARNSLLPYISLT